MKRFTNITLLLALLSGMAACGSDNKKEDPTPATKAELLTSKDWITSAATLTIAGQTIDAYTSGFYEDCEKDNILRFNSSTYMISEGTVSCTPPTTENGTWAFNADQTKLIQTAADGSTQAVDILELTTTSLKLSGTVDFLGTPITVTQTFKKK